MRPFIIGTAGHVDHGKTSLIRFLTGVNTDRLREEQARGITIELGFAPLQITHDGKTVDAGIVDVPGHERFVKNMVAGAGGVDVVMMVIAADEGVMPQTREHLDICRLLGVETGLVVLSKVDLVEDPEWLALVEEDVREALVGTFLEGALIVPFSTEAADPDAQRTRLETAVWETRSRVAERDRDALFRLPVDRVFSLRGHGTVVTGTVLGGELRQGEEVALLPSATLTRVRSIQSFGKSREDVAVGMRAALNVPGVETAELRRGLVVVRAGSLEPTDILDARLRCLDHAPQPFSERSAAILHVGSAHTNVSLRVLGGEVILPGEEGIVRLHLEEPVVALPGDRFILRGYADVAGHGKTLGGGTILHLSGGPYRVFYKGARLRDYLGELAEADDATRVRLLLRASGHDGRSAADLAARSGIGPARLQQMVADAVQAGAVHPVEEQPALYLDHEIVERLGARIEERVTAHLAAQPLLEGMPREELRSQIRPPIRPRALAAVLAWLAAEGRVTSTREHVGLPGREAVLEGEDAALAERLQRTIVQAGLAPPRLEQIAEQLAIGTDRVRAIVALLARRDELVRVSDGLYYAPAPLAELRRRLVDYLERHGEITTQAFKELSDLTRRWVIPLAEFFDHQKVTLRKGEVRVLRK